MTELSVRGIDIISSTGMLPPQLPTGTVMCRENENSTVNGPVPGKFNVIVRSHEVDERVPVT
jgi:hypothetical protein